MLYPSVNEIRKKADSRYTVVVMAAKRARDIIDNQNANTRSILDFIIQDKLSTLQSENQSLRLAASQAAQNQYLVNELRPCPIPAYITCNPYAASYGYPTNGYGYGCGTCA